VLARILLRPANIIVLDEATSALDNLNEDQFMKALESSGRTIIAIAHRLSTLRQADQIVVMDHGRIEETGTYDTLDAHGGLFHELLHAGEGAAAGRSTAAVLAGPGRRSTSPMFW